MPKASSTIQFQGSIDKDSAGPYNKNFTHLQNVRFVNEGTDWVLQNIKGNELVASGSGIVLKAINDPLNENKFYYFVKSQLNASSSYTGTTNLPFNDYIAEYDSTTKQSTILLQSHLLNFNISSSIHSDIVGGDLLFWTDGKDEPRRVSISNLKQANYKQITGETLSVMQSVPLTAPAVNLGSNNDNIINSLVGYGWQFAYRYISLDNELSPLSSYTDIQIVPQTLDTHNIANRNAFQNNQFDITIPIRDNIKELQLLYRRNNSGQWYIGQIANTFIGTTHKFIFTNNEVPELVPTSDTAKLEDSVPQVAKTQEVIKSDDGQRIVYGNIKEGYGNTNINVVLTPISHSTSTLAFDSTISNQAVTTLDTEAEFKTFLTTNNFTDITQGSFTVTATGVTDNGVLQTGADETRLLGRFSRLNVSINLNVNTTPKSLYDSILAEQILYQYKGNDQSGLPFIVTADNNIFGNFDENPTNQNIIRLTGFDINLKLETSNEFTEIYKLGAQHLFGIQYFDKSGRSFPVQINSSSQVYNPYFGESGRKGTHSLTTFNYEIKHSPPSGAMNWRWMYGGNSSVNSHQILRIKSINTSNKRIYIEIPNTISTPGIRSVIDPNSPNNAATTIDDFRFRKWFNASSNLHANQYFDYGIINTDTDGTGTYIVTSDVTNFGINDLIQVYNPETNQSEEGLYWEVTPLNRIVNGLHVGSTRTQTSTLSATGAISTGGDTWLRFRPYTNVNSSNAVLIEDLGFSDYYRDNQHYSIGRYNIPIKSIEGKWFPNRMRFSDSITTRNENGRLTNYYNGLTNFPEIQVYETDPLGGGINSLNSRESQLIIFQEDQIARAPIQRELIENIDGTSNLAVSSLILGKAMPYQGIYGCQSPESIVRYMNHFYFTDNKRGEVLKLQGNGITTIGDKGLNQYFKSKLNGKVISAFDWLNNEYIMNYGSQYLIEDGIINLVPLYTITNDFTAGGIAPIIRDGQIVKLNSKYYIRTASGSGVDNTPPGNNYTELPTTSKQYTKTNNGVTLAYNENLPYQGTTGGAWSTFYDLYHDFMVGSNTDTLVSFNKDGIWLHNTGSTYNTFHSGSYSSSIESIINDNYPVIKYPANTKIVGTTPTNVKYQVKTDIVNMVSSNFKDKQKIHYAPVNRILGTSKKLYGPVIDQKYDWDTTSSIQVEMIDTSYNFEERR